MMTIPLHGPDARGRVALVDDEDYPLLSRYRWEVIDQVRPGRRTYSQVRAKLTNGSYVGMHNLIMNTKPVDHANRDPLDNQKHNLRTCTAGQNMANRPPQITSGRARGGKSSRFKGVSRAPSTSRHPWRAQLVFQGEYHFCGFHDSEEEAARAYDREALRVWGEFAYQNFPAA